MYFKLLILVLVLGTVKVSSRLPAASAAPPRPKHNESTATPTPSDTGASSSTTSCAPIKILGIYIKCHVIKGDSRNISTNTDTVAIMNIIDPCCPIWDQYVRDAT